MDEDPPRLSDREEEILDEAPDRFPPDAPPEQLDAEQLLQGRLWRRRKAWVAPREIVGGED